MANIETWFGTFYVGEDVVIVCTGLLGEKVERRGTVVGKRYSRGTEYLTIQQADGKKIEVPLRGGTVDFVRPSNEINAVQEVGEYHPIEEKKVEPTQTRYSRVVR